MRSLTINEPMPLFFFILKKELKYPQVNGAHRKGAQLFEETNWAITNVSLAA